jgi:lipopolysaccharide/colanic/teichoic acid biosynthesis glycosyltransferase
VRYDPFIKRLLDLALASAAFLFLSPLFLLIIILIKLDSSGPAFYIQERIGKGMRPFRLIKFRSMTIRRASKDRQFDPGDVDRVTRVGSFLRKTKLDELPELINIVRGEMSIVGPRPEVPRFVEAYPKEYREITQIRPGLSDFASIKYRHEEEILACHSNPEKCYRETVLPDKLELAQRYCKEVSLRTDLRIIANTIKTVIGHG